MSRLNPARKEKTMIKVSVRWFDGYLESFDCSEVRFGAYLLWMRLANGQNRHIPVSQVRWYSVSPESHEPDAKGKDDAKS